MFPTKLSGCVVFAVLGNMAFELNQPIKDVVKDSLGLSFIAFPAAIARFQYVPQLFAFLFFLMFVSLGMGGVTALTSTLNTILADFKPTWNKTAINAAVCFLGFLSGLPYLTPVSFI